MAKITCRIPRLGLEVRHHFHFSNFSFMVKAANWNMNELKWILKEEIVYSLTQNRMVQQRDTSLEMKTIS